MKKMMMAIAAMMVISTASMAQDNNEKKQAPRKMDRTEMVKHRTDRMVKEYGLDEAQAQKLLELNTAYADKMPRMGGQRPGGPRPQGQSDVKQKVDGTTGATAQQPAERPSKEQMEARRAEMMKNTEAYHAELKKILTDEQYNKFIENQKNRQQRSRDGRGRR